MRCPSVRWFTVLMAGVLAGVAACGSGSSSVADGAVQVVAAENFYGDLAAQVGGQHVEVTSILSNPNADPHLFEPTSKAGLAVADARVVIENGVGYDDWMTRLLAAAPSSKRVVVTAADALHVDGSDPNPHVWYDTPALPQLVTAIQDALTRADPPHAADYQAGAQRTIAALQPLLNAVTGLGSQHSGVPVAYTERVPGLLLQAAGLRVLTPPSFARAVEDGTDPSPADVATMQRLLIGHQVRALLYNEQATSPLTDRLRQTAATVGVPVVPVTETEPAGSTFVSWQLGQVQALTRAVS